MTYFHFIAAVIGTTLVGYFIRILRLRIKAKTFVGEGTDPVLRLETEHLNDLLRYTIAGLVFLALLWSYDGGGLIKKLLEIIATFVFMIGFLVELNAKRKAEIVASRFIVGRSLIILAIAASCIGLVIFNLIDSHNRAYP